MLGKLGKKRSSLVLDRVWVPQPKKLTKKKTSPLTRVCGRGLGTKTLNGRLATNARLDCTRHWFGVGTDHAPRRHPSLSHPAQHTSRLSSSCPAFSSSAPLPATLGYDNPLIPSGYARKVEGPLPSPAPAQGGSSRPCRCHFAFTAPEFASLFAPSSSHQRRPSQVNCTCGGGDECTCPSSFVLNVSLAVMFHRRPNIIWGPPDLCDQIEDSRSGRNA